MTDEALNLCPIPATRRERFAERPRIARVVMLFVLIALCCVTPDAVSQEPPQNTGEAVDAPHADKEREPTLEYITVLCPEDKEPEWRPHGEVPHRLVAPSVFSEMLRNAHPGVPPAIRSAHYEARFAEDEVIHGRAMLAVEHLGPMETTLSLEPCNLALERAGWADRDGEAARIGLAPSGQMELRVDHGGKLDLSWSLKGVLGSQKAVSFDLKLPPAPSSRFLLALPENRVPVTSKGILSLVGNLEDGMQTWQIELGAANEFSLRIGSQSDPEGHSQSTEVRTNSVYRLAPGGLEAVIGLRFNVLGQQPLRRIELSVASELNLESVRDGNAPVPWGEQVLPGSPTKKVVMELETPLHGLERELTLTALAPIQLNKPWCLPAVKVSGVRWCESVAALEVQHPLRLNDVTTKEGRVSKVRSYRSQPATDTVELQLFSPEASIDVVLGQEQTPLEVDYGVIAEMSGGQITGRQKIRLKTDDGEHFRVIGTVTRPWVVDTVQAEPADVLADWRVERSGRARSQLIVDFARPLSSNTPVQLLVSARRLESTVGRRYASHDMIPVEFASYQLGTALVALHALESYQIELSEAGNIAQRELQGLSLREQQLFPGTPRGKIYAHEGDKGLTIRVRPLRPLYTAEIDVVLSVSGTQATESYVFRIHPESVRLENVAIEVLKRPGTPLRWEPATGDEPRLDNETSQVALQAGGRPGLERWNVRLRPSRSETFELRARRVFPVEDGAAVGLARLPDAMQQTGRLIVDAISGERVRVENRSLAPEVSAPLQDALAIPKSVYCYDPRRSLGYGRSPIVLRLAPARSAIPKAWIWRFQLESKLEPSGEGWHIASYRVESAGTPVLRLTLPASLRLDMVESVEVDGRRAPLESAPSTSPEVLAVRLEGARRFHEVTVCYRTSGIRWTALQSLQVPFPAPELPVLNRSWVVWLPPGRQLIGGEGLSWHSMTRNGWPTNVWGPMAPGANAEPTDPFASALWQWTDTIQSTRAHASTSDSDEVMMEPVPADWGELLTHASFQTIWRDLLPQNSKARVLVDVEAVASQGVSADTSIMLPQGASGKEQISLLLNRAGLALAISGRYVVLTNTRMAATHSERPLRDGTGVLWRVTDDDWANDIARAASNVSRHLLQVPEWEKLRSQERMPWTRTRRPGYEPRDTAGWTAREIELPRSGIATAYVVDRDLLVAGLWFCFLLVAFLTWTFALRYPVLAFVPITVFLVGAAYLPDFWSPWLSAGFWGSCAGLVIRLVTVKHTRPPGRVIATRKLSESNAGIVIGGFLALVLAVDAAAQAPKSKDWPDAPALVFAPVGEDGKPTGGNYSVPELFYLELKDRAQQIAEKAPEWLLKDAYYHGAINWQATGEPLTVTNFTAEFGLEVIRGRREVKIPMGETRQNWILEAAWLDGASLDTSWDDDGNLVFEADPSEWSQLRLQLQPVFGYGLEPSGFRMDIPPVATSRLELTIPAGAPRVEVPTAMGRTRRQPLKLETDLGPTDQLVVKWQPTEHAGSGKVTRVDELMWLNLAVGGAILETQFRFECGQDFGEELDLLRDPRLIQRGGYEVEGATLDHVKEAPLSNDLPPSVPGSHSLIRQKLFLKDIDGSKVIVRGQFVLREVSGVGAMRLPDLRSDGFEVSRRCVAATVDSRLHCQQSLGGQVQKILLSEFVDLWGGERELPTMAYQLFGNDASFGLATSPKTSKSSAQWKLDVKYGIKGTHFEYRADVDTSEGYLFCHRLTVPAALDVHVVNATVNDLPRSVRWARSSPDQIVLFFDEPLTSQHSIEIRGHISAKGERSEPLLFIDLQDVEIEAGTVDVYRQTEAIVELDSVEGMTKVAEKLGPIVSRWVVDGLGKPTATAHVKPNRPEVVVREQIISLRQTSEGWQADLDCQLEVKQGIVDKIRVETSEQWPGPYVVSPGITEEPSGEERRELVLRPSSRPQIQFRVSGPLVPKPGGRATVPRIRVRDVEYVEDTNRLIVLPSGPASAIRWEVLGLTAADVPSQFLTRSPGFTWIAYRVQQDDFVATIRPSSDGAQVYLADIRLAWDRDGECRGVAILDVEAGDRNFCVLRLPPPWELIALSNRGVPISPQRHDEESWKVSLGQTVLPQRLELVFRGHFPSVDGGIARIEEFPELVGVPVLRGLWTFTGIDELEVVGAGDSITREKAAMTRLRNVTLLVNSASRKQSSLPREDKTWYRGWLGEWADARREAELAVALAGRSPSARADLAELEALDLEQKEFANQLDSGALWEQLAETPTSRITPALLWDQVEFRDQAEYYLTENGVSPSLLQVKSTVMDRRRHVSLAPAMYVAAVLMVLLVAWTTGRLHRWPHLFGVVVGLCWWLWLWPSSVGLVLVATCLLASIRSGWRRPRSSGSAIVRLSVSGRS